MIVIAICSHTSCTEEASAAISPSAFVFSPPLLPNNPLEQHLKWEEQMWQQQHTAGGWGNAKLSKAFVWWGEKGPPLLHRSVPGRVKALPHLAAGVWTDPSSSGKSYSHGKLTDYSSYTFTYPQSSSLCNQHNCVTPIAALILYCTWTMAIFLTFQPLDWLQWQRGTSDLQTHTL